jgi:signal transduction histidine kinase
MSGGGQKLLEIDDLTPYLNSSFIDFWKGKEREGCLEAIAKAKKGDTGIFYGYFETAKGTPKWWEVIVTPIKGADGSIDRLLAVSRDITERRRAEKVVENLNKDLKSTVVLLTQSNRQLREFAHLAAHDLKTPLRGIGTLAQWLVDDYKEKFDDEGRRQIDLLVKRVERMNELINAILQYSTITRERDKEYPVDLNTLVGAVLVEIRPPPSIKITINKNLPTVICKEAHLRQVFCHLLTNAIKFMDKPEGHVTIDYTDRDDRWEFSVSDNGPGIEPQHFERIFRIFQTLDDNDQSKGGGIGLTIARKIVELYDGRIWLTSEPGQGSTFFFTLPKALSITNNEKQLLISSSSSSC